MIKTRDGVSLYRKEWGSGRPVVLIHGWPLTADTWDDTAIAIAKAGLRAIAYDRRGFGRSDQPYEGYDYNQLTDDLAEWLALHTHFPPSPSWLTSLARLGPLTIKRQSRRRMPN